MAVRATSPDFEARTLTAMGCVAVLSGGIAAVATGEIAFVGGMVFSGVFHTVMLIGAYCTSTCLGSCSIRLEGEGCLINIIKTASDIMKVAYVLFFLFTASVISTAFLAYTGFYIASNAAIELTISTLAIEIIFFALYQLRLLATL